MVSMAQFQVSVLGSCFQWLATGRTLKESSAGRSFVISIIIGSTIFRENDLFLNLGNQLPCLLSNSASDWIVDAKASRPAQKVGATSVAGFPQARSRTRQGEDRARRGDAAQLMFAERHQRRAGLGSDRTRDQHGVAERPAQSLEPADEVDRGADGGEIEPVGGADIAPQDFAEM